MQDFIGRLHEVPEIRTIADKVVALLWYAGRKDPTTALSAREAASYLEQCGYPSQNLTRLRQQLLGDSRTSRAPNDRFRLRPDTRRSLDAVLGPLTKPLPPRDSESVIPRILVQRSRRGYLERVVRQVNVSYDVELYDCCAVMLRRLVETLVIEVYEAAAAADDIKGAAGHFHMLDDLLKQLERDSSRFHLGRNSQRGLKELKDLGDKSAHNRRFNATRSDVDRLRADLRTAVEELIHLAKLDGA